MVFLGYDLADHIQIIGIYGNPAFSEPIEYTLDLILSTCGVKYKVIPLNEFRLEEYDLNEVLAFSYGREYLDRGFVKQIHIYASDFFGQNYLKLPSMPRMPLERYDGLPVIYSGSGQLDGFVKISENLVETNIDIIASSFFMVSRYEEVIIDAKDKYDRFPASASIAFKEEFLDRPLVNEYVELIWSWINSLDARIKRKAVWPQDKKFAVCLTHDVDGIWKYSLTPPLIGIIIAIIKEKNLALALKVTSDYLGRLLHLKRDPHDTFDYITWLENRSGFKSSFYFMAGGNSAFDRGHTVQQPKALRLAKSLERRGFEIGLHPSFNSYADPQLMASEKSEMDKVIGNQSYGCRQHYLRWKTPDTWRIQEQLGFLYDTTLSFADHIGFRCGICLPFRPFDVIKNRQLDCWELPLTVMDRCLQAPDYQNLPPDEACQEIIRHIDTVKKFNGVFVLLWHNSSLDDYGDWKGWRRVYEKVMEYISDQNAFVSSGREIIKYWSYLRLTD